MLTLLVHLPTLRMAVPAVIMLGSAPNFFFLWSSWRLLTSFLPTRFYQAGDEKLYSLYQRLILFFYEHVNGTKIILYDDSRKILDTKENAIYLANHQSTVDWVVTDMLSVRQGSLGNIRYVLKDGLRYFPLYGFYFKQHSCIYVKRSGKFQQERTAKQFDDIKKYNTPYWMVVFPEGTRYNPEMTAVVEKSKSFAIEQGLEPLKHHLTPRVKASYLAITRLRGHADAVYDATVAYGNTYDSESKQALPAPGMPEFLQQLEPEVHIHIDRILLNDIPQEEEKFRHWLHERFLKKDKMMSNFYVTGKLTENGQVDRLSLKHTLPAFLFFAGVAAPMLGTEEGRGIYWRVALGGSVLGALWMAIKS